MQLTDSHIDIQTTLPAFRQKLNEKFGNFFAMLIGLLISLIAIPVLIIAGVFYVYPKHLYDTYILKKSYRQP